MNDGIINNLIETNVDKNSIENNYLMDSDNEHIENHHDQVGDQGDQRDQGVQQQGRRERQENNHQDPNEAQG